MTRDRTTGFAVLAALALGGTACGGGTASSEAIGTTVTQSGDTTIIVPALDGPTGRLVSDLVLGADDTNPDAIFGRIAAAALAPDGRIYVIETQTQTVHVYTPTGEALPRLTRQGEGPGEVRSARDLAVLDDGRVLVREVGEGFEVFDAGGTHLATWDVGWGSGPDVMVGETGDILIYHGRDIPIDGSPWLLGEAEIFTLGAARSPTGAPAGRVYRMSSLGALADTVPSTILDDEIPCLVNPPRMSYCIGLKYHPGPWMAIGPDGALWSGRSDGYRLDRSRGLAPSALPRVSIRPPREALPIDEGLGAAMDGPARERFGDLPSFDETYPFPTHKPAVARVLPTRDGTVWVRLHAPSEPTIDAGGEEVWIETESRFDIFTPEGEHVGYVTGPAEMWIQDIRGDTVLATRVGDYGVPYVERFIIVWSDPN